jgi:hypothetical protein
MAEYSLALREIKMKVTLKKDLFRFTKICKVRIMNVYEKYDHC